MTQKKKLFPQHTGFIRQGLTRFNKVLSMLQKEDCSDVLMRRAAFTPRAGYSRFNSSKWKLVFPPRNDKTEQL
jgi:hypothetical protein